MTPDVFRQELEPAVTAEQGRGMKAARLLEHGLCEPHGSGSSRTREHGITQSAPIGGAPTCSDSIVTRPHSPHDELVVTGAACDEYPRGGPWPRP